MANKEGMVVQDVDFDHSAPITVTVDLNLDDDEVAIGGVTAAGPRILYKAVDDGTGKGLFPVIGEPGPSIVTGPDTPIPAGPAVPLPVAPVGTRRMTVQNISTGAGFEIRVREVGGAGGILLFRGGSTSFGGADGAIAALEAILTGGAGPGSVGVTFEG
ncbi:MAG: hypothetical protein ACM31I_06590 [Deltaproteobacteria bacterium]